MINTNDLVFCSFPKSGITYFSFLFAAARLKRSKIDIKPTMFNIDFLVVDVHKMAGIPTGKIWTDGLGDVYKSHDPYFFTPNAVYILRNPVDTLKSYYHFRKQLGSTDTLAQFLQGPEGISAWIKHISSWLIENKSASQSIFVIQYEKVLTNPAVELNCLAAQLGIEFSAAEIEYAVQVSSISNMRVLEDNFSARNPVYSKFGLDFVRKSDARVVDEFNENVIEFIKAQTMSYYNAAVNSLR